MHRAHSFVRLVMAPCSWWFRLFKSEIVLQMDTQQKAAQSTCSTEYLFFFYMVSFSVDPLLLVSAGGAPDQLLLGRQQQPHRAPWPQPALPGAVPHRRGAVQGPVQLTLPLGQRSPLWPAGYTLLPSSWPQWRCTHQLQRVHQWPGWVQKYCLSLRVFIGSNGS